MSMQTAFEAAEVEVVEDNDLMDGFITEEEICGQIKVTRRTFRRWRRLGEAPPFVKIGSRRLYHVASVREWMKGRICPA